MTPEDLALVQRMIAKATAQSGRQVGTVVSRDSTGPGATVLIDPASQPVPAKVTGSTFVQPGDRCLLDWYGDDLIITQSWSVTTFGEASLPLDALPSATTPLTSSSFVDLAEFGTFTFTKTFDLTFVYIQVQAEAYTTGTSGQTAKVFWALRFTPVEGGIGYTPTDISVGGININQLSTHVSYTSMRRRTDIPAGTYTVSLRWRRVSGAASVVADTNDSYAVGLDERVRTGTTIL